MYKILKYTAYFFAGLLTLLLVAVLILKLIPDTKYKDWITSAAQSATGRDLSIEALELDIGTAFRVKADKVRLANADWAKQDNMLLINHLEADFGLLALLTGKADIRAVVEQAEVLAENNAEGVSNWALGTGKPEQEADKPEEEAGEFTGLVLHPFIREIRIDNFKLTLVTEPGAPAKIIHLKHLLIETPEQDTTLSLAAELDGHPIELFGNLGNMQQFLDKASEPVHLTGNINGNMLDLSGSWGPLFPQQTMDIDIGLKIPSSARLAELAGLAMEDFGAMEISGEMTAGDSVLSLNQLLVKLDGPSGQVTIKGSIADLLNMQGISISTNANTVSLEQFLQRLGIDLPYSLPPEIELSAQINGGLEKLALGDLVIAVRDEGMEIKATASIGDLLNAKEINGKLTGTIDSFSGLSRYLQMDLPTLGKIQLSGDLTSNGNALQLSNLDINLHSENLDFAVNGGIDDLLTVSGINVVMKTGIRSFSKQNITELTQLLKQFDAELPVAMLPESISLRTGIQGNLTQLSLIDIQGKVLDKGVKVELSGAVENVLVPTGIKATVSLDSDSLAALSQYAGSELPQTDPLKVRFTLREDASLHPFTLHAETGDASLNIDGTLSSLALPEQLELGIAVQAASLSDFDKLAQTEFSQQGALDLRANLQLAKKNLAVNDLKLLLGDQSAFGNLSLKLPEDDTQPTVIDGKLDIPYLNLDFLLPEEEETPTEGETLVAENELAPAAKTEDAEIEPEGSTNRLFSSAPFLYERLHDYEIDFSVNADKIQFGKSNMKDVQLIVTLKDGLFSADPIKGAGGAGNINGFIRIDGRTKTPVMEMDLAILQIPMPNIGGKLDFDANLVGAGQSVAELMGSLNGQILLVLRDGKIEGRLVKKLGAGMLSFSKDKGYTILECATLRMDIKDGIADFEKNMAAQFTEVTWRGGGEINLKTEELDAGITPKPRKGIPISIGGSLAGLVHIGGTLKNPKVQLDPKDVAIKYAKYSAHIATGGLTFIAESIKNKIDANKDICEMILDGTVFDIEDEAKQKEKAE